MKQPIKILVTIPNFGLSQFSCLRRMVDEFRSYSSQFKIDIVVHSNVPLDLKGADVRIVDHMDDWWLLPFESRKTLYERRHLDYDVYIFSENDHLITEKNIRSFLNVTKTLPSCFVAGFIQFEESAGKRFYPAYHLGYAWVPESGIKFGEDVFAQFSNHHQGSFMLTRDQFHAAIKKLNLLKNNSASFYRKAERVGADVYQLAGFTRLICISRFNDFLIRHLPDSYLSFGADDSIMQKDIAQLLKNSVSYNGQQKRAIFIRYFMERCIERLLYLPGPMASFARMVRRTIKSIKKRLP